MGNGFTKNPEGKVTQTKGTYGRWAAPLDVNTAQFCQGLVHHY